MHTIADGRTPPIVRMKARISVIIAKRLGKLPPAQLQRVLVLLSKHSRPATYEEAEHALLAVVRSDATCAGRFGCLPRSIATCLLLRTAGIWPMWCSGIPSAPPFRAHAWIEAEGRIVAEIGELTSYCRLMTVPEHYGWDSHESESESAQEIA